VAETSTSEPHDVGCALRKIRLLPTSVFSAPCGVLATARLAKRLRFERAPAHQRDSRQIAPSSVRIGDWEEEYREERRVCFEFVPRGFCPRDKSRRSGVSGAEGYKREVRDSPGSISGACNSLLLSLVPSLLLFPGTSAIAASRAASQ